MLLATAKVRGRRLPFVLLVLSVGRNARKLTRYERTEVAEPTLPWLVISRAEAGMQLGRAAPLHRKCLKAGLINAKSGCFPGPPSFQCVFHFSNELALRQRLLRVSRSPISIFPEAHK